MLTKFLAVVALLAFSLAASVLTLMFGWGLEPKSWTAIVLVGFFGHLVVQVIGQKVLAENKE